MGAEYIHTVLISIIDPDFNGLPARLIRILVSIKCVIAWKMAVSTARVFGAKI